MHPGERVETIKRVADRLASKEDWEEIDLILDQFGFVTSDEWDRDMVSYVRECIQHGDPERLVALDGYLSGPPRQPEGPWEDGHFRLFLTHIPRKKDVAFSLKRDLEYYGVDAFVAHADIGPGKEWHAIMESALYSCDALAGVLHEGFRKSDWCDQEVGIALGRGVPVIPIQYDFPPYGFFGSVQAVNDKSSRKAAVLARKLVRVLLQDKATAATLRDAIVLRLTRAATFAQANELAKLLAEEAPLPSRDRATLLRRAEQENRHLQDAFPFDRYLSSIEVRIPSIPGVGATVASAGVEPF